MIPQLFNGMIAILLANWALNDLPHAAGLLGSRYDEPATPGQIQYIAVLCQQLKITAPYEERMRTFGEAGRMIRELETEREHRKKLGSGNPTIRTDTNEEVSQDRVSGVAIAWMGSKDVGSLHYDFVIGSTGELSFMQVDEEHRGLGVGRKMYEAVEDLARSYGVRKLTGEVGIPGYGDIERAEKFWKEMGFTVTDDHAEKQLGSGNPGVILTPISPAEPHILEITYRGEPMVGTLTTYTERDSLVVYELAADEPGIVSKEFLFALGDALEAIARQKGLVSIKIKYFPQHLKMYELAGFTQSYEEGESSLVVRHVDGNPDTVRETPFLPIGVWFDSPKIEAEVKSAPGLLEYIGSSLGELGKKYGTRPKSIGFAKVGVEDLAVHVWSDVIFNVVFVDLWLMDEERTRQVLKYLIPHEFGHYMMAVEHVKIPFPKGPKWKEARSKYKEKYADEFAERESGMTREQVNTLTGELGIEWEHKKVESGNPEFVMYHATPKSGLGSVLSEGIRPSLPPHQESPWAPREPVVYIADSIERVVDYAEQAYEVGKVVGEEWAIVMIKYDEFPEEIHTDSLWGVPGTYYTTMHIPPEHLTLVRIFSIGDPDTAVGAPTIIGTGEQREAAQALILRCAEDIPPDALNSLTIQFGIPEHLFHPGEKQEAIYNIETKTIYLPQDPTEYDLYHELSHYLDDVTGHGIARHAEADRFARKWGTPRKHLVSLSENPDTVVGTCYPDAWRYLIREEGGYLVHGSVQLSAEGPRVNHAWVELPTGYIWEPQTGQYFTIEGFKIFQPIEKIRYTDEQAAIMLARTGKHGPWTEEEGAQWLK